jgi:hypothetical protein
MELWELISASGIRTRPEDLTVFARELPDELGNSLNSVLPDREIQSIQTETMKITRRSFTAKYRTWNTEVPIGQRAVSVERQQVQLLPLGQMLTITEWESILQFMAQGGTLPTDRIVQAVYSDVAENVNAVRNRVELARGDFLNDGKFTLVDEYGLKGIEYDAGLPATHRYTVATLWSDPTATALTDEVNANNLITDDTKGKTAAWARASRVLRPFLARNIEYRRATYPGIADNALPGALNLDQVNQVRIANHLTPLVDYDHKLSVDGADVPVLPADRIIIGTTDVGETQWGLTAEALSLATSNNIDFFAKNGPGITALAWKKPNPYTGYTQVASTPMPVAGDINGLVSLKVL